ncbi:arylesterase [Jiella sp. M17.18]|uniref:arylesterase n=1 Tax=Jiella sp. M17.18 TaxID=3234247 RepID=UPI0034DFFAAB
MQRFQPIAAMVTVLSFLVFCGAASAQTGGASGKKADDALQIVAFGDSLTQGYGVGPGEAFPEQLQAALRKDGYDVTVANAGVSGDTTTGGLARLDWSVPASADLVILELGANDALRGVSPDIVRKNLDQMLAKLTGRGQAVILAGMLAPPNMGADYAKAFDAIYPELADKYHVAFYPFFLDGVAAQKDLDQADGMHPNKAGVAVIVKRMLPLVEKTLDEIKAG